MNYEKIYNNLIEYRKNTPVNTTQYYEIHHIIPRCLNGNDNETNLIALTAREHFIAHRLLEKFVKEKYGKNSEQYMKVLTAVLFMANIKKYKITSREYEYIKIQFATMQSINMSGNKNPMYGKNYQCRGIKKFVQDRKGKTDAEIFGEERAKEIAYKKGSGFRNKSFSSEHKEKLAKAHIGFSSISVMTDDEIKSWKQHISEANKGRKKTEEHKRKISEAHKGKKHTEETKQRIRAANTGRKHTDEEKKKMSNARKGKKFTKKHCENISKNNGMHGHSVTDFMTEDDAKLWKQHMSEAFKGRKRMFDPKTGIRKMVKKEECEKLLKLGYIFGWK